jgi:LmbE family N-acetylglucosaminyl deacetylase
MRELHFQPYERVLDIWSHPDDEVTNGAGTARAQEEAETVHTATLTLGTASTIGDRALVRSGYRKFEMAESLQSLDISPDRQHYGEFPDGKLHRQEVRREAANYLVGLTLKHGFTKFKTMGPSGGCGHPDHIESHNIALGAARLLGRIGTPVDVLALNGDHTGEFRVPVEAGFKQGLMGYHRTQNFWARRREMEQYGPLMDRFESYDLISSAMRYTRLSMRQAA